MAKCRTCSNSFSPPLTFITISTNADALCVPYLTDINYPRTYLLTSIDVTSIIGQGYLQSIAINGVNKTSTNTTLSSIVFNTGNLLNFDTLTAGNEVGFNLFNLGINHYKVFAKIVVSASCPTKNSQLILTVAGT
jgi:hypothetical protein